MVARIPLTFAAAALAWSLPALAQDEPQADSAESAEVDEDAESFEILTAEEEAIAEFEREMNEAFALFGELFQVDPLTEEQEALLPLTAQMTDKIMPLGSFATAMDQTMAPMMDMIMGAAVSDPRLRLAEITGVASDELEMLEDEPAQDALDIFDPEYAERTDKMGEVVVDMIGRLLGAMEPAYRDALSRAFAVRFEEAELVEILAFFETPAGEKFARNSFMVHYDPQMLGVMEQMGPAMVEIMPDMIVEIAALEAEFEQARKFTDLSEAERERAAQLIGKSVNELEALTPSDEEDFFDLEEEESVI